MKMLAVNKINWRQAIEVRRLKFQKRNKQQTWKSMMCRRYNKRLRKEKARKAENWRMVIAASKRREGGPKMLARWKSNKQNKMES